MDIFTPHISQIVKGLQGKTVLIYGDNRTGKTYQATRLPKPYVLAFEPGLEAVAGVPFLPITRWSDAERFLRQLLRNVDKFKKQYQTIIIDPLDAFGDVASAYAAEFFGLEFMGQKKKGTSKFSPEYKFLETIVQKWIRELTGLGFTVVFLDHPKIDKQPIEGSEETFDRLVPAGDNRVVKTVSDLATIIYLKSNGVDEEGNVILSTAYFKDTPYFKAGGRYDHLPYSIEFTAENLEKAFIQAVELDEKAKEVGLTTIEEYNEVLAGKKEDLDTIKQKIGALRKTIQSVDPNLVAYFKVLEDRLGDPDVKILPLGEERRNSLELILIDLEQIVENIK